MINRGTTNHASYTLPEPSRHESLISLNIEIAPRDMDYYYGRDVLVSHSLLSPANCSRDPHRLSCQLREEEVCIFFSLKTSLSLLIINLVG